MQAGRRAPFAAALAAVVPALLTAGCAAGPHAGNASPRAADIVLRGGAVYTLAEPAWAGAVAVARGRIVWVGDTDDAPRWIGEGTRVVELEGRMVLPAFHDSHVHPVDGGIEIGACDLNGFAMAEEVLARIKSYAAEHPDLAWIRGGGSDLPLFPGANPSQKLLDAIVLERPVYLNSADPTARHRLPPPPPRGGSRNPSTGEADRPVRAGLHLRF